MSQVETGLHYTDSHEWVLVEGDVATVGITDHAQALLGDLVYVELPEVDAELNSGDEAGVVESVKAASDVYTPVSGTVVAINEALEANPELVNSEPYAEGWLYRIRLIQPEEVKSMLSAEAYQNCIEE